MTLEYKTTNLENCEIKADGDTGVIAGYASVFNGKDSYGDTILPGAYIKTLKKNGLPKMFLMHESSSLPIGKWTAAYEDDKGLKVEGELTRDMARAEDTLKALKHGTLDGLSIGYWLTKTDWTETESGGRVIKNVTYLAEVSPVCFPADKKARVTAVKSDDVLAEISAMHTVRELENLLRDACGLSKSAAQALVSNAKRIFTERDSGDCASEKMAALSERIAALHTKFYKG